jgi:hypothetical protein
MKRTIAWVITLLLVLTMLPAYNSAKAEEITPLSIAINTKVTKRVYAVGEALNLTGLILDYYNGLVQAPTPVDMTSYVASAPAAGKFMTSTTNGYVFKSTDVGERTITITYNSGGTEDAVVQKPTTTFTVTVVSAEDSYPTGFTILTEPANTTYSEGESLNTTGLTLRTTYLNGSTPDLALSDVVITPQVIICSPRRTAEPTKRLSHGRKNILRKRLSLRRLSISSSTKPPRALLLLPQAKHIRSHMRKSAPHMT